jgi:valyl-tRNA synthetase
MPFVTEVLWQELKKDGLVKDGLLLISKWPQVK